MPDRRHRSRRPPDAGTTNEWTVVGDMKVYVWLRGRPTVLGRQPAGDVPPTLVAIAAAASRGGSIITCTPHQARALASVLTAAAAHAERPEREDTP